MAIRSVGSLSRAILGRIMSTRLSDLPVETLRRMLRDTERSYPGSVGARIIRREIDARERYSRPCPATRPTSPGAEPQGGTHAE